MTAQVSTLAQEVTIDDLTIDSFRPEDAPLLAECFGRVYGPDYPDQRVYRAEYFLSGNADGSVVSAVARTPDGTPVGHCAAARTAPYPGVVELCQGVMLPEHRRGGAAAAMIDALIDRVADDPSCEVLYGRPVCNQPAFQKVLAKRDFVDTGLELDLCRPAAFARERLGSGRVSTLLQSRSQRPVDRVLYLPEAFGLVMLTLQRALGEERRIEPSTKAVSTRPPGDVRLEHKEVMDLSRLVVRRAGRDLCEGLDAVEESGRRGDIRIAHAVLSLGDPAVGDAVAKLRRRGFFFGAFLPRWLDDDAVLLQRVYGEPNFGELRIHGRSAEDLVSIVRLDHALAARRQSRARGSAAARRASAA